MRTFCTEGPVNPLKNYFVPRTELIEHGMTKVEQWRYFTIFAPRQSGKTTYFQFLLEAIVSKHPCWLPIWISFESLKNSDESDFLHAFTRDINLSLARINAKKTFHLPPSMDRIKDAFIDLLVHPNVHGVLIIDEVEGLTNLETMNSFLHLIRSIYHTREQYNLRSVILTGVSNITGLLQDTASPFNIADQIDLPNFTRLEVHDLLGQHEQETGQEIEYRVQEGIYEQTLGQPGLVNALARDLVEDKCSEGQRVTMDHFFKSVDSFTRVYFNKNIPNILNKANLHSELMKEILFGNPIAFDTSDERIASLYANGVIEDCQGICCVGVPLYKRRLYNAFKPKINGEKEFFKSPLETYKKYIDERGFLDVVRLMWRYIHYVKDRGNIIFSKGKASEGVYHYNIDAFFSTYAEFAGARCFVETPVGGGRVDLLILQKDKADIIEIKRYDADLYEKSQSQLKTYLDRSGFLQGHLVMFSEYHETESYEKRVIEEKTLHLWVIPVKRSVPSHKQM